jgi:hypothetical protein
MNLFDILKDCKITKVLEGSSVAGTALAASAVVEMDNYNSVCFIGGGLWTSGAGHLMKAQKCATTTGGTPVDLSGASATILNANQTALLNIQHPRDRYIRAIYIKAAVASAYWPIFAIQYNGRRQGNQATTSDADAGLEAVSVVSPTS